MADFSITNNAALFKITYDKISANAYNSFNVLLGTVKKEYNFEGKRMDVAVPLSFAGGSGSGSTLPTANPASYEDAQISSKKVYQLIEVDREALKAGDSDRGAFVRMTKEPVRKGVEKFNWNMSRILFNDGTGALGSFSGNAGGSATVSTCVITAATWKEFNFAIKDYVNVNSLSTVWEVTALAPSTRTVTLTRISGSDDLTAIGAGTHVIYLQNSKDNDPEGLKGVLDATSGSKYGINIGYGWQAYQKAAGGVGISPDLMNEGMLGVHRQCGQDPNLIITSYVQYRKLLNQLEDQKRYFMDSRYEVGKGKISFQGIEFMSMSGPVGVFVDKFCEDDRMYLLNKDFITLYHRPGTPSWADDDGTVFLRAATTDKYQARYAAYLQAYIPPTFHGVITGLAT